MFGSPFVTPITSFEQEWVAGPLLLLFGTFFEDSRPFGVSSPPEFVLYSDGRLVSREDGELQEQRLSQQEVCELLESIDAAGFFTFDAQAYHQTVDENVALGLLSDTRIYVYAWQSREVRAEGLEEMLGQAAAEVPPELRATYELLGGYRPRESQPQPYAYEEVALALYRADPGSTPDVDRVWTLDSPRLADLYTRAVEGGVENREEGVALLLSGEEGRRVLEAIEQAEGSLFAEDGEVYGLSARPLLPYESLESAVGYRSHIPSRDTDFDPVVWRCNGGEGR
jgi:hypothetical protein